MIHLFVKFTFEQRRALLALVNQLINADAIRERSEDVYFSNLQKALRLDEDIPLLQENRSELLKLFKDRKTKTYLMIELMSIGLIDNIYDIGEGMLIEEMATTLGFSKEELATIKAFVINDKKMQEAIESFINK